MKNKIFNEDCLDTIKRDLQYDYCFFSPPDYDELDLTPIKDDEKYYEWMRDIYSNLNPNKNVVTIVQVSTLCLLWLHDDVQCVHSSIFVGPE